MKKKILAVFAFVIVAAVIITGCASSASGQLTEGIIEYDASVLNTDNPMASYAPSKMTFKFKDSRCRGEISAGMGMLNTVLITNPEDKTLIQLVRIVTQKYFHVYDLEAVKKENSVLPEYNLKNTDETKLIAGYKCKRVIFDFKDNKYPDFDVYYTTDIEIESPNWASPFFEIDGVLMEYQVSRYGMDLRFTAKSVKHTPVETAQFEVSEDYKEVKAEYLDELFKSFQ